MKTPILMVAYYYPPRGGGGTQRTVKYAKYLPQFGFKPVILTASESAKKNIDTSLSLSSGSTVPVVRVPGIEFSGKLQRLAEFFLFPDAYRLWARRAIEVGIEAAKKFGAKVIYSTASPYIDHIVGREIARATSLPWVADFRDLWTTNALYEPRAPLQRYFHQRLEKSFYQDADVVISASPWQRRDIISNFNISPNKIVTITNGFDPEDFPSGSAAITQRAGTQTKADKIRIGYLGSFYGKYRPDDLVKALEILQQHQPDIAKKVLFEFIGDIDRQSRELLMKKSLADLVHVKNYVPHKELRRIREELSAYLLYFPRLHNAGATIPQKIFEYLASRKPILAIIPDGDAANILKKTGGALVTHTRDPKEIANSISSFVNGVTAGHIKGTEASLEAFSRPKLAQQLGTVLSNAIRDKKIAQES